MKSKLISIFLLTIFCLKLYAQRPVEVFYTQNDGLFTNQVIHLLLDHKGRLWVSYSLFDRFSRFDGLQWEHWDLMEEGISGNYLLDFSDEHGVWFKGSGAESDYLLLYSDEKGWKKFILHGNVTIHLPESKQLVLINPITGRMHELKPDSAEYIVALPSVLKVPEDREYESAGSSFFKGDTLGLRSVHPDQSKQIFEVYDLKSGEMIKSMEAPSSFLFYSPELFLDIASGQFYRIDKDTFIPFELKDKNGIT
ncbi:MAG: hypothetical protein EA409_13985, partial [Saprospirales bacterium]